MPKKTKNKQEEASQEGIAQRHKHEKVVSLLLNYQFKDASVSA